MAKLIRDDIHDEEIVNDKQAKVILKEDDNLISVKLKLPNKIIEGQINQESLEYDTEDPRSINVAAVQIPNFFAKFATMLHVAKSIKAKIEVERDKWYAETRKAVASALIESRKDEKSKAPTKDDIDSEIRTKYADEYDNYEEKLSNIENKIGILAVAVETIRMKKELLKSVADLVATMINHDLFSLKNKFAKGKE